MITARHRFLLAVCGVLLGACVSLAPRSQTAGSQARLIDGVPARRWADNSCAAGALSEVLNWLGDPITEERLSGSLAKGRRGGVVTVDLLLAARSRGFDAQLVRGDAALVERELIQQHALILMLRVLDAPGKEDDLFHYLVISGIDPERALVSLHYGDGRKRWVSLSTLQSSWAAAGYATFLIGTRKRPAATEDDLKRAVVLEEAGKTAGAIALYRSYLRSHPESALAWTNLGNAHAALYQNQVAEAAYRNALVLDKEQADALNNLAWLLFGEGRLDEAELLSRRAAALDRTERYAALDTLGRVLVAKGKCGEALATLERAMQTVPAGDLKTREALQSGLAVAQRDCVRPAGHDH